MTALRLFALLLVSSLATWPAQAESSGESDRLDVLLLSNGYAWGVDTLDREQLAQVFTHDAIADYVSVGKNPMNLNEHLVGFDAIFGWLKTNLGHRKGTEGLPMHFVSNQLVELRGDEADLRYYMHNRASSVGGVYYAKAVKTDAGWRIRHLRLEEQTWNAKAYESDPHAEKYFEKPSKE